MPRALRIEHSGIDLSVMNRGNWQKATASAIVLDVAADVVVVTHRDEEEIALIHKE